MNFASLTNGLSQAKRGEMSIHGDGYAGTKARAVAKASAEAGIGHFEGFKKGLHGVAGDVDGFTAAGHISEEGGDPDDCHSGTGIRAHGPQSVGF